MLLKILKYFCQQQIITSFRRFSLFLLEGKYVPVYYSIFLFRTKAKEDNEKNKKTTEEIDFDAGLYQRAKLNDFFSKALGPREENLKKNEPHSIRSALENIVAPMIREPPENLPKETLSSVKEDMKKKRIRIQMKP